MNTMKQQVEQLNKFHQNLQKQADAIWLLEAQKKLIPYFSTNKKRHWIQLKKGRFI